MNYTSAAKALP